LRSGGRIAASVTTDFFRFVSGSDKWARSSAISATLTQPLWRGAGYRAAIENLTQAERNLLYALRNFTRYRREFSVDIASQYYSVLQGRDRVRNEWIGYQNAISNAEEGRAKLQEGQLTLTELGLLEQSLLSSETRWISEMRNYKQNLDQFKILLGLPTNERIVLDAQELNSLSIEHPELDQSDVTQVALISRLDLYNQRDQLVDAERKIYVAANNLKPGVDLVLGGGFRSDANSSAAVPLPKLENYNYSAGLDVDLPLGVKDRRNNYRATLINLDRAQRQLELAEDQIKLAINNDWRALDQAKRNFEISEIGVKLSASRVEEQQILRELGQGTSRDLVQAQEDLVSAKNQRINALVSHKISRLNLWRDMGILFIHEGGQWEEKTVESELPQTVADQPEIETVSQDT
jgi:outer membrane protein TolC